MPEPFKKIFSAIDSFPLDVSFSLSQQPELPFTEQSGLLHDFGIYNLAQLIVDSWSAQEKADDQSTTLNEKPPDAKGSNELCSAEGDEGINCDIFYKCDLYRNILILRDVVAALLPIWLLYSGFSFI